MIDLRLLVPEDAGKFRELRLLAINLAPSAVWPTQDEEAARSLEQVALTLRSSSIQAMVGAFDTEALVGITGLRREPLRQVSHKASIWGIFVNPSHRRMGVAQALLSFATDHARREWGCGQLQLRVNSANEVAKHLYGKLGFRVFGSEPQAMRVDGQFHDEDHMAKVL